MTKKSKNTVFPSFGIAASQPKMGDISTTPFSVDEQLKMRNQSFYGAVFNALDDYLRKGHAYSLPAQALKTDFSVEDDDVFYLKVTPAPYSDDMNDSPEQVAMRFLNEIYEVVSLQELESITAIMGRSLDGDDAEFIMKCESKYDLLQVAEQLLKPYDMVDSFLPSFHRASQNARSSVPFSLFPQYSLPHIRAMYMMTQGRTSEVQGIYMNH